MTVTAVTVLPGAGGCQGSPRRHGRGMGDGGRAGEGIPPLLLDRHTDDLLLPGELPAKVDLALDRDELLVNAGGSSTRFCKVWLPI